MVMQSANPDTSSAPVPAPGQRVTVRHRPWVVTDVVRSTAASDDPTRAAEAATSHLISLSSLESDGRDEELRVVWELEQATDVHDQYELPSPHDGFDEPGRLDAFLDAVRWGAIASADKTALQAPFRSGVEIQDYQLDPVVRALSMPRTNLLIADDVGLGKTVEAGLVMQELMLRHRARSMLIVCPAGLTLQWRDEMRDKCGGALPHARPKRRIGPPRTRRGTANGTPPTGCSPSQTPLLNPYANAPRPVSTGGGARVVEVSSQTRTSRSPPHAPGAKPRRGPWVFLESRTWTVPGVVATSTQSLPSLLCCSCS